MFVFARVFPHVNGQGSKAVRAAIRDITSVSHCRVEETHRLGRLSTSTRRLIPESHPTLIISYNPGITRSWGLLAEGHIRAIDPALHLESHARLESGGCRKGALPYLLSNFRHSREGRRYNLLSLEGRTTYMVTDLSNNIFMRVKSSRSSHILPRREIATRELRLMCRPPEETTTLLRNPYIDLADPLGPSLEALTRWTLLLRRRCPILGNYDSFIRCIKASNVVWQGWGLLPVAVSDLDSRGSHALTTSHMSIR